MDTLPIFVLLVIFVGVFTIFEVLKAVFYLFGRKFGGISGEKAESEDVRGVPSQSELGRVVQSQPEQVIGAGESSEGGQISLEIRIGSTWNDVCQFMCLNHIAILTVASLLSAIRETVRETEFDSHFTKLLDDGRIFAGKLYRSCFTFPDITFRYSMLKIAEFQRHPNIAKQIAIYVTNIGDLEVISQYMPKGTLASYLFDEANRATLHLSKRLDIAMETIRALKHLHTNHGVPHGNVRANAIGFDRDMTALLLDCCHHLFLSSTGRMKQMSEDGLERGEEPSLEDDVFCCGVLILELLMGCEVNGEDYRRYKSSPEVPLYLAMRGRFEQPLALRQPEQFVDPSFRLEMGNNKEFKLLVFARAAMDCFRPPNDRPTIKALEEFIERELDGKW